MPVPQNYSRNYQSVPQPGLNGRVSPVYSAAVVGGGLVINGMFFNRGSAADYDAWEQSGNPGWSWKDLLPYFKRVSLSLPPRSNHCWFYIDTSVTSCYHSETFTPPIQNLEAEFPISADLFPMGQTGL